MDNPLMRSMIAESGDSFMKRLLSEKQRSWLAGELASWKSQSIVSPEQAEKILGASDTRADEQDR